ncbi:MAG TPA: cell envelope integrity protein CreD [Candidatus Thiothrix moscowensis]|uniref:cell envelope integrity protein CreD n=1 Tax=unclassified Thiothrix TaxID=2636184 RepID=UPI0025FC96D4|nr:MULTISPECIES: cell envelope integrity protein CreD [unclassified Thiothrix]HRJ54250.1 cell envelope integrity protein CreD [Candidatus Thiothrix moscowensis]HRJ94562.1 cell envelope integrity protein CreD [Candidatus Thiothrix moscowensis]
MHNQRFYLKLALIAFLILFLLIPQAFMLGLVGERESWRYQAYQSIEQSWPGMQTLAGPLLTIPYQLTYNSKETVKDKDGKEREILREVTENRTLQLIPAQLDIQSQLESSLRYRGIYDVPVYASGLQVKGEFNTQPLLDLLAELKGQQIRWETPQLSVLVRDQRGIASPPSLQWNGSNIAFKPGSNLPGTAAGMHARLPNIDLTQASRLPFAFKLELRGMRSMNFALLAENSAVQLAANWPHPSFSGELLPETREVNDAGFNAQWRASSFSYNVSGALAQCGKGDCSGLLERAVGFELIQPVDVYQQAERSVKYAVLFIVLTFVVLILFELLKKLRVHPVQYTLVGFALLVFYLLLISLSEHIAFLAAYALAASASTGLLTLYFGAILHSRKLGLMLGAGLAGLYALLYVILQAEENALLMGSVLIFAVLAVLMLATRHFDWYALTAAQPVSRPVLPDAPESGQAGLQTPAGQPD